MTHAHIVKALTDIHRRAHRKWWQFWVKPVFSGICSEMDYYDYLSWYDQNKVINKMTEWPGFSGNYVFPVPLNGVSPDGAYKLLKKWNLKNQYGRNRMDLLEYLIDHFKNQ